MEKGKRRNFTPKQLLDEAQQQKAALAQLGGWQRNAMLASSCGAALAWWGLTGGSARFAFGIAGALLISVFTLAVNLLFRYGNTDPGTLSCFILAVMSASMISLDLILPISLCFGTEKGRLFYLGTVILLCAAPAILDGVFNAGMGLPKDIGGISFSGLTTAVCAFALLSLLLTVFSITVSIRIFDIKELV